MGHAEGANRCAQRVRSRHTSLTVDGAVLFQPFNWCRIVNHVPQLVSLGSHKPAIPVRSQERVPAGPLPHQHIHT